MLEGDASVFYVWQSVKELLEYAAFVPEVVGTPEELMLIGSVPADKLMLSETERNTQSSASCSSV